MNTVKLTPALKELIWGGQRLKNLYNGKDMNNIAESWVLSCHPAGESVISEGELLGQTLNEAIRNADTNVLGANSKSDEFPILIKFIDAADNLSVQVHPDNDYARIHENENGKTECWYILDSNEDSELIFGMEKELTKEEFRKCIEDNTLLSNVRRVKVKKGDVAFIPAGTLHAIGKGILLAEVQQSSNTTYRVYDYGRLQNGKPRELHIDKAVDVTVLSPTTASLMPYGECEEKNGFTQTLLAKCEYFEMRRIEIAGEYTDCSTKESFISVIVTDGSGEYDDGNIKYSLIKGDSIFIPANNGKYKISGQLEIIRTNI